MRLHPVAYEGGKGQTSKAVHFRFDRPLCEVIFRRRAAEADVQSTTIERVLDATAWDGRAVTQDPFDVLELRHDP